MPGRRDLRRSVLLLVVGAIATVAGLVAHAADMLPSTERAATDARFSIRGTRAPSSDVVLVGVDRQTLQALRVLPPLPRTLHARMLDRLRAAGANAIAYDFVFGQPTTAAEDNALVRAVIRTPNLVMAARNVDEQGRPDVFDGSHNIVAGSANFEVAGDHAIRRVRRFDLGMASFAVAAAQMAIGHGPDPDRFGAGGALIDYAGPAGTYPVLSFAKVLDGEIPASALRGKVVVVGATDPLLQDIQRTPFGAGMPGPEVQANAIATVLDGEPLRDAPDWLAVALIAVAGIATPLSALALTGLRWLAVPAVLLAGGAVVLQLAFDGGVVLPVVAPALALLIAFVGTLGVARATDVVARRRIAGTRRQGTVLCCELRGLAPLAEDTGAHDVLGALDRRRAAVREVVLAQGGTVASSQSDLVLGVFGSPLPQEDHAERALRAARDVVSSDGRVGIGVSSGPVVTGTVGSQRHPELAVLGDAADAARRLASAAGDGEWRIG